MSEYVSPHYQEVLDNLSESLRAQRQAQLRELMTDLAIGEVIALPLHQVEHPGYDPAA